MRGWARALVALAGAVSLAATAPARRVDDLAWLGGTWSTEDGSGWTEERWAPPRGGVMLGTSLTGRGGAAGFHEFMRIAADGGGIAFFASPGGKAPVRFAMVSSGTRQVAFENPANDYPVRIEYRRDGDRLTATISGPGGADPRTWRFRRAGR